MYEVRASFRPFTVIGLCIVVVVAVVLIFFGGVKCGVFVPKTESFDVAVSILAGLIASVFVAIIVECAHNLNLCRRRESVLADLFALIVLFARHESQMSKMVEEGNCADFINGINKYYGLSQNKPENDKVKIVWNFIPQFIERRNKLRGFVENYLFPEESRILNDIDIEIGDVKSVLKKYFDPRKKELVKEMYPEYELPDFLIEYYYSGAIDKIFDLSAVMNLADEGIIISENMCLLEFEKVNDLKTGIGCLISKDCKQIYEDLKMLYNLFGKEPCIQIVNRASRWM